jgi:hypothetical protein
MSEYRPPRGAARDRSARTDPRLLDELRRAAAFLHGHGAGDGAVAVDDAIELLKVERPARKGGEPLAEECGVEAYTPGCRYPGAESRASGPITGPQERQLNRFPHLVIPQQGPPEGRMRNDY